MKKIIVILLALTPMFAFAQNTQPKKTAEERVENQTERLAAKLNLTEAQKAKVTTINEKYLGLAKDLKAEGQADKQARREEAKKLSEAHNQEMQQVLTEEQYTQYLTMKDNRVEKVKDKRKQKRGQNKQK
jgi:protein CpxP